MIKIISYFSTEFNRMDLYFHVMNIVNIIKVKRLMQICQIWQIRQLDEMQHTRINE